MTIASVPYEDFSNTNQQVVEDGGSWVIQSPPSNFARCGDTPASFCGGHCLFCAVDPLATPPTYYGSFITNISVNLANYGDATSLDFIWAYWPAYGGSSTPSGLAVPITSQVGDVTFPEAFPSVNYTDFFNGAYQWTDASRISHNSSTSVVLGSDPNRGYIAIKINVTMNYYAGNHNESLDFGIKGVTFLITTPIQSAIASSSSAASTQQGGGSSAPSSPPAGIVAGAVIGALALVALIILAVWLLRRRHKNEENPVAVDNASVTVPTNNEALTPLEDPVPPPHLNMRYRAAQEPGIASIRAASFITRGPYGPPPTYGPDEPAGQDRSILPSFSPELARFAAANRDFITENLEARLQAAGYLPSEDPSRLTPDEWRNEYGVTKLEVKRLQNLYERARRDQPQ